uniref:Uncharacterized protein n=1 Tax=Glossina palpalis gambiensis TaxID=67801 RepID=A0A1B0AMM7_9MUSC
MSERVIKKKTHQFNKHNNINIFALFLRHCGIGRCGTAGGQFRISLIAKNLYVIAVHGIRGRLNRLPAAGVGDMFSATVKMDKPELRKKVRAMNKFKNISELY